MRNNSILIPTHMVNIKESSHHVDKATAAVVALNMSRNGGKKFFNKISLRAFLNHCQIAFWNVNPRNSIESEKKAHEDAGDDVLQKEKWYEKKLWDCVMSTHMSISIDEHLMKEKTFLLTKSAISKCF